MCSNLQKWQESNREEEAEADSKAPEVADKVVEVEEDTKEQARGQQDPWPISKEN